MTQDVTKTGSAQSDEDSIANEPVGVVEEKTESTDASPIESTELPVAEMDADTVTAAGEASEAEPGEGSAVDGETAPSDAEIIEQLRTELAEKESELAAKSAEVDEQVDKLQRAAAEYQNTRRRQERQLSDSITRANADLIRRLLPIVDDLDLAFQNAPQGLSASDTEDGDSAGDDTGEEAESKAAADAWVSGFRQIQKKLLALLEEEGVTPIDASGEFDPLLHEAVLSEPSDEVESGHVIGVLRAGYEFKGQVLRPAMVRVAA